MARRVPIKNMLTLDQIGQLRNKQARQVPMLFRRLREFALDEGYYKPEQVFTADGEPVLDEYGHPVFKQRKMTDGQIKAAQITINAVLPAQQTTTINDISNPVLKREEIEAMYRDALTRLKATDIRAVLMALPDGERDKALAGIDMPQEKVITEYLENEVEEDEQKPSSQT